MQRAPAPRARRVRDSTATSAPAWRTPACRSSTCRRGQQPLANETDSLWVVFNGEIFNYVELRAELEALGHRFRTRSDTEVIVHAYEAWGAEAFRRFNGQWAIALWDRPTRTLVLARDPFGVRPLFLCRARGRLFFASEVKAIFAADPAIPRAFDPIGLDADVHLLERRCRRRRCSRA